jgi:hypothetical protein
MISRASGGTMVFLEINQPRSRVHLLRPATVHSMKRFDLQAILPTHIWCLHGSALPKIIALAPAEQTRLPVSVLRLL